MTKKLNWRLKNLPTGEDIAALVKAGIITKEDARTMLFNEDDNKDIEALSEEVKFLRDLVDTLARKNNSYPAIYYEYKNYSPHYPLWYKRYEPLMLAYHRVEPSITLANFTSATGTITPAGSMSRNLVMNTQEKDMTKTIKPLGSLN